MNKQNNTNNTSITTRRSKKLRSIKLRLNEFKNSQIATDSLIEAIKGISSFQHTDSTNNTFKTNDQEDIMDSNTNKMKQRIIDNIRTTIRDIHTNHATTTTVSSSTTTTRTATKEVGNNNNSIIPSGCIEESICNAMYTSLNEMIEDIIILQQNLSRKKKRRKEQQPYNDTNITIIQKQSWLEEQFQRTFESLQHVILVFSLKTKFQTKKSCTTTITTPPLFYEIFLLPSTTRHCTQERLNILRNDLQYEFINLYGKYDCRAYASIISEEHDDDEYEDEDVERVSGSSAKKTILIIYFCIGNMKKNCIVIVLQLGTDFVALSTNGNNGDSVTTITRSLLATISGVLCSIDVKNSRTNDSVIAQRMIQLKGRTNNPLELLSTAISYQRQSIMGRLAYNINSSTSSNNNDPIKDLYSSSNKILPSMNNNTPKLKKEEMRLNIASKAGVEVANQYLKVDEVTKGKSCLVGIHSSNKCSMIIDHSFFDTHILQEKSLKEFGINYPKLSRLQYKWTGETNCCANAYDSEDDDNVENDLSDIQPSKTSTQLTTTTLFKCAITFEGDNVIQGFQSLVSKGILQTPLPGYIRDAPMMSSSGTIIIDHGHYHCSDNNDSTVSSLR